jgi:hypothetical protein
MPHQVALTIRAPIKPGQVGALKRLLTEMADPAGGRAIPFERLGTTHFARLFVLDEVDGGPDGDAGPPIPASLVYMSDVDAPVWRHLIALVRVSGARLDDVFAHCEGWPSSSASTWTRVAWLRARRVSADVVYVNTVGRSVAQVHGERRLRQAIEDFLDGKPAEWHDGDPVQIHAAVRRFVGGLPDLRWALEPARGPGLAFRVRSTLHKVGGPVLVLLFAPLLLALLPIWAVLLRRHERRDVPDEPVLPSRERLRELADLEDHVVQNPFTAVGVAKPGRFRFLTMLAVLRAANYATRHIFNHGSLTGVKTIHFARWVAIDDRRRLIFASSYDGSLESYMDEFIDKVAWGLNAVFSNGLGYPRTRWLVLDGANDERAFKAFLRNRQLPTQLWYSAYDDLSAGNIENNAAIRAGLAGAEAPTRSQAEAWLARL